MNRPAYRIELHAMPHPVDVGSRLQRLLKAAKRSFGFRCLRVEEIHKAETSAENSQTEPHKA